MVGLVSKIVMFQRGQAAIASRFGLDRCCAKEVEGRELVVVAGGGFDHAEDMREFAMKERSRPAMEMVVEKQHDCILTCLVAKLASDAREVLEALRTEPEGREVEMWHCAARAGKDGVEACVGVRSASPDVANLGMDPSTAAAADSRRFAKEVFDTAVRHIARPKGNILLTVVFVELADVVPVVSMSLPTQASCKALPDDHTRDRMAAPAVKN